MRRARVAGASRPGRVSTQPTLASGKAVEHTQPLLKVIHPECLNHPFTVNQSPHSSPIVLFECSIHLFTLLFIAIVPLIVFLAVVSHAHPIHVFPIHVNGSL